MLRTALALPVALALLATPVLAVLPDQAVGSCAPVVACVFAAHANQGAACGSDGSGQHGLVVGLSALGGVGVIVALDCGDQPEEGGTYHLETLAAGVDDGAGHGAQLVWTGEQYQTFADCDMLLTLDGAPQDLGCPLGAPPAFPPL